MGYRNASEHTFHGLLYAKPGGAAWLLVCPLLWPVSRRSRSITDGLRNYVSNRFVVGGLKRNRFASQCCNLLCYERVSQGSDPIERVNWR